MMKNVYIYFHSALVSLYDLSMMEEELKNLHIYYLLDNLVVGRYESYSQLYISEKLIPIVKEIVEKYSGVSVEVEE